MKSLLLYLSFALLCVNTFAQKNYVPGIVITSQNDSLRGFIDYRNWNISPAEIRFKTSLTDKADQHFGPGEIKGFRLAEPDETYLSTQIKIDITRQDAAVLDRVIPREIQDTLVFLRILTTSNYNLYGYIDKNARAHYLYDISGKPGTMQELEYVKAYVVTGAGSGIFEKKTYQDQLTELFKDCPAVIKHVSRLSYNEMDMLNLFLAYDNCKHPSEKPFVKKKEEKRLAFGVLAGFSSNSFKLDGPGYVFNGITYSKSGSPLIGASMDLLLGRKRKPFVLRSELLYKQVSTEGSGAPDVSVKIGFTYLQLSTIFRYTYPKGTIRPFINAGIANSIAISTKDNIEKRPTSGISREAIDGPRAYEQSLLAGAGVFVYKFSIEGRYATSNGFSSYASNKSTVNSFQLIAAYRF